MGSLISDIYIKYFNFPLSDVDSARYFFSSVPQSLASLIAISFTVLLIYIQIGTDKYSIHTVRSLFDGWDAIAVLSVFLITIISSLYNLALVRDMDVTQYPWDTEIKTIFILSVICCLALMSLFYRIIHQLTPEIFIKQSCKRMKNAFILNLDLTQLLYIKNNFYAIEINKLNNIEESFLFGALDSSDFICVKSSKRGFVEDIDTFKIEKCSKLLSSVSDDCRLILVKPIKSKITSTSNILGQIKCPDKRISFKVEYLINKAYKINLKDDWMLADYKELEPISSLTINAIRFFEKGVVKTALQEYTNIIVEYIKVRKNFELMPTYEQSKGILIERSFLEESYYQLEKIMEVSINESDADITKQIINCNTIIAREAINLQDFETVNNAIKFYIYFSYKLKDEFINEIMLQSQGLAKKILFDIDTEKYDIQYLTGSKYILEDLFKFYGNFTRIFVDNQKKFSIISLDKWMQLNSYFERFHSYDYRQFELETKLKSLNVESDEYKNIQEKLYIIEEKEKLNIHLKDSLGSIFYSIGTYAMLNLESGKSTVEFSRLIFDKLINYFTKNNLSVLFSKLDVFGISPLENWLNSFEDEEVHFIDTSYLDRFYILMNSLLVQRGNNLKEIKPMDRLNQQQLDTFQIQIKNLKDRNELWDQLLENESEKYFDDIFERLRECAKEREINLHEKIREAKLSEHRVDSVIFDITDTAKKFFASRKFMKVEKVEGIEKDFIYFGENTLFEKIYFIDDNIDPTTHYNYNFIGPDIGRGIGLGESNYIAKKIFESLNIKGNKIQCETLSILNIREAKKELEKRGFTSTTLLVSFDVNKELYKLKEFIPTQKQSDGFLIPIGVIEEIDVYESGVIPKDTAILFDKNMIGTLKILEDLNPKITTDFEKDEIINKEVREGKIKESEYEIRLKELDEYVNIKSLEKIRFEFGDPKAGFVLYIKSSELI